MFPPDVPILTIDPESITQTETDDHFDTEIGEEAAGMNWDQLIGMSLGAYSAGGALANVIGNTGFAVAGAAGETSGLTKEFGLKPLVMADGPAGLRLSMDYALSEESQIGIGQNAMESMQDFIPKPANWLLGMLRKKAHNDAQILHHYATAIPIGTALAQSWNPEFAELCGDVVGEEMEQMDVDLWLAPALNIHRDIRCGRNFEYFSEDPLISGTFAAALTRGVQAHSGRGTTIKHYAANNQERNRYNSNSQVSERAMREIYLKGFEICIREAQPLALMTSYNLLNGLHTSEHTGLIRDILRCEFGFRGIVMTDWVIAALKDKKSVYPGANAARVAAAGGELFMPGSEHDAKVLKQAVEDGTLSVDQLRRNVSRTIALIRKMRS